VTSLEEVFNQIGEQEQIDEDPEVPQNNETSPQNNFDRFQEI
jgi:hypothetical protein